MPPSSSGIVGGLERATHLFGGAGRLVEARPVEDHEELLAAVARDDVAGPEARREDRPERAQDRVAGAMPVPLVERPEVIEVEQDGRHRTALDRVEAVTRREQAVQRGIEVAAVEEPGQRVADGRVGDLGQQLGVGDGEGDVGRDDRQDLDVELAVGRWPGRAARRSGRRSPRPRTGSGPRCTVMWSCTSARWTVEGKPWRVRRDSSMRRRSAMARPDTPSPSGIRTPTKRWSPPRIAAIR